MEEPSKQSLPKSPKALLEQSCKENFTNKLEIWLEKHKDFLNEKSINEKGKTAFTHRRDDRHITLLSKI